MTRFLQALARLRRGCAVVVVLLPMTSGCRRGTPPTPVSLPGSGTPATDFQFQEVDLDFTYHTGRESENYSILESLGGGVGILDYDADQSPDLFLAGGGGFEGETIVGRPAGLFRQTSTGSFTEAADVAHVDRSDRFTHGCAVGDYNNDGFPDVVVTGYGGLQLFLNLGDGTFDSAEDAAQLVDASWSSSAAWGDLDGDGCLDLYVAHYVNWSFDNHPVCPSDLAPHDRDVCPPASFEPLPDVVYFSNGDGTFRAAADEIGLSAGGKGLGVLIADLDHDADADVYVGNDTTANFLYLNDGAGNLAERGLHSGVALDASGTPNGSMGLDVCDFNGDLLPDLWVTNYEHENFALYRGEGSGLFLYVSRETGITDIGDVYVGFGTSAGDFDADGDEDLLCANGHVIYYPLQSTEAQMPVLLANTGTRRFEHVEFSADTYLGTPHIARGLAVGDLNRDGRLDAAVSHANAPATLLLNETPEKGDWLALRLIGRASPRDATAAHVVLHTSQGDLLRHLTGGGSYLSAHEPRLHWGLAPGVRPQSATIVWPSGRTQDVPIEAAGQVVTVIEPKT